MEFFLSFPFFSLFISSFLSRFLGLGGEGCVSFLLFLPIFLPSCLLSVSLLLPFSSVGRSSSPYLLFVFVYFQKVLVLLLRKRKIIGVFAERCFPFFSFSFTSIFLGCFFEVFLFLCLFSL